MCITGIPCAKLSLWAKPTSKTKSTVRERVRPLVSLGLDLLVLRLMNESDELEHVCFRLR
jgi:hypothetical protein